MIDIGGKYLMRKRVSLFDIINNILLILVALICIYPFIYILAISLSDGYYVMSGSVYFFPKGLTFNTYKFLFSNVQLGIVRGLYNSVYYSVVGTVVALFVTYMTAYVLSRKRFKPRYIIMLLFTISWVFEAGIVPAYIVNSALGLVNTRWIMIIPGAINTFYLIITRSFLDTLPIELEESAFLDGANDVQIMLHVFLPVSLPIVATISVLYSIEIWNSFMKPLIYLHDVELHPIQLIIYNLVISPTETDLAPTASEESAMLPQNIESAHIFLGMLPILFIYPIAQKYFVKGLMIGSIKG